MESQGYYESWRDKEFSKEYKTIFLLLIFKASCSQIFGYVGYLMHSSGRRLLDPGTRIVFMYLLYCDVRFWAFIFSTLYVEIFMEIDILMSLVHSTVRAVVLRIMAHVLCSDIILFVVRAFGQKSFAALKGLRR